MKPTIHVLTGCTAVGKTEWALRWAEANGAEIVSRDSLLFYRGMDIGTGQADGGGKARGCGTIESILWHRRSRSMLRATLPSLGRQSRTSRRVAVRISVVTGGSGFYL